MTRAEFISRRLKPVLFLLLLMPALGLVQGGFSDTLGANPVETITRETGTWALRILLLTLAITPLCRLSGISEWVRLRRMLGLYSFFYAVLHFTTYALLDHSFDLMSMIEDVLKRPYITFGFIAFLLLIPLAVTSHRLMIRRLGGKRWKRLHRLVYVCALGAVLHYLWLVKADSMNPLLYLALYLLLMSFRIPHKQRALLKDLLRRVISISNGVRAEERS